MSTCEKINCPYHYKGEEDKFPCCHFPDDEIIPAPCEESEEEEEDD